MAKEISDQWLEAFNKEGGKSYSPDSFSKKMYYLYTNSKTFKIIQRYLPKKRNKILEPGCGSGKLSVSLAIKGNNVYALDYSKEILGKCKALAQKVGKMFRRKLGMHFVHGDLTNLQLEEKDFDLVVNEGVVEHWLDRDERISVIKQMVKVARKGGRVIIIVPNGAHPYHEKWMRLKLPSYFSAPPMTRYSTKKLKLEMEEAGLKVVYTDGLGAIRSLNYWPQRRWLVPIIEILNFVVPLRKSYREKWGANVLAVGIKK